ncbi:hypothetical protein [uncultured Roseibium sp.]|uniref:hypothetical protein n=1 Tax=uncultured Roseibium sp. TaxID=1936171 RepID=UPI002636E0F8|nr:hypothetical protein [uncultured Roseibium sp.]
MTVPRWEVVDIGEGETMLISHLESGDRIVEISVVQRGTDGDFLYDVFDDNKEYEKKYADTLSEAQREAENIARRALWGCL